ncbi:MAG: sulfatase [Lacipirellulaceae bacterium]
MKLWRESRVACTLLLLFCALTFTWFTSACARPNVLFIAVDDLNDWVGFLDGHPQVQTPNMDRLAKRGVVFSNAHCAAPLCGPSRAAIFSGMQPFHSGVFNNQQQIRKLKPDLVLLPQYFKNHGYRTLGTGKLMHRKFKDLYDESFFTEQRWSPYADKYPQDNVEMPRFPLRPLNEMPNDRQQLQPGRFSSFDWGAVPVSSDEMGDGKVARWAAERLVEDPTSDAPFFLAVGFYRPHIPLYAPQKYFDLYPAESTVVPEVPSDDLNDLGSEAIELSHSIQTAGLHKSVLQHDQWRNAVAAYLACVTFVDEQVGRLLKALDEGPHAENTIVILWSDHGWHLGEKEHWGKTTGWERSTRVPLMIISAKSKSDGCKTGSRCDEPVGLIDLYPTLIEMCSLPAKSELDGESLLPQLKRPQAKTNRVVLSTVKKGIYSVRSRHWRLIEYSDGSSELYDHRSDPQEWRNLADDERHRDVIEKLSDAIPNHVRQTK